MVCVSEASTRSLARQRRAKRGASARCLTRTYRRMPYRRIYVFKAMMWRCTCVTKVTYRGGAVGVGGVSWTAGGGRGQLGVAEGCQGAGWGGY